MGLWVSKGNRKTLLMNARSISDAFRFSWLNSSPCPPSFLEQKDRTKRTIMCGSLDLKGILNSKTYKLNSIYLLIIEGIYSIIYLIF